MKSKKIILRKFSLSASAFVLCLALALGTILYKEEIKNAVSVSLKSYNKCDTVIIDSGHGGFDGGADLVIGGGFLGDLRRRSSVLHLPDFADNEQYFLNKYMVSGANTPSTTSEHGLQLLVEYSERIAESLKLVDGILHIQYIEKADGTPYIIEICRRPPGDLYIKFVKYATGVDYPLMLAKAECGLSTDVIASVAWQSI